MTEKIPKTVRLHYDDAALLDFGATVVAVDGDAVVLDRTAFYATAGGQPHDTGTLAGVRVVGVEVDDAGVVRHRLASALEFAPGDRVAGTVDGARRLDHLEQHHGQHLLSAAFEHVAGARTVGFHLGETTSTIDLEPEPAPECIIEAEALANRVVRENRAVTWREVPAAEVDALDLRKRPAIDGPLRIVEIDGFDRCACGGTHPPRTGAVGAIRVLGTERRRSGLRLAFVCGARADAADRTARDLLRKTSDLLTCGADELPDRVGKLRDAQMELRRRVAEQASTLRDVEAEARLAAAVEIGGITAVLAAEPDREPDELADLARAIVGRGVDVAAFAFGGARPGVLVACADGFARDARELLNAALAPMEGRGGGTATFARGGGRDAGALDASIDAVRVALESGA